MRLVSLGAVGMSIGLGLSPAGANEALYDWEMACTIRKDKFAHVLPGAMRRHDIDMWIVIDKGRGTEPLFRDFGSATSNGNGVFVFTDRDPDSPRVERVVFRELDGCEAYDFAEDPERLAAFVAERDPKRIAVNFTTDGTLFPMEGRHLSDGLSRTDHENLKKTLDEPYASRLVSAELLIADFRAERVASELVAFAGVAEVTRRLEERALSNEVIVPERTTHNDVHWWLEGQRQQLGFERGWFPTVYVSPPDGNEVGNTDRIIRRGDVLQIDWGIGRNNFFTDIKRFAYVLREDEAELPDWVRRAFDESRKIRKIIQENVRPGETGRVQLDRLKRLVSEAGYVYTERERASDVPGTEVNIGMHPAGNLGHDAGAALFEIYPTRTTYTVRPNSIISVEFIVFMPVDNEEWQGRKVPVNIEENAVITERGIEWLHPPQQRVLVIR